MPNTNSSYPVEANDMQSQVLTWLRNTGYPLEMRVAKMILDGGLPVFQGAVYSDIRTEKRRETDVVTEYAHAFNTAYHKVTLVIECKSTSAPWVCFQSPDRSAGLHAIYGFIDNCSACIAMEKVESALAPKDTPGYSIVEKRNKSENRQDLAHEGVEAALDAAEAMQASWEKLDAQGRASSSIHPNSSHIWIPVVVTTSPLFFCRLRSDGELDVTPSQRMVVQLPSRLYEDASIPVEVFTETAFEEYLVKFNAAHNEFKADIAALRKTDSA